MFEDGASDAESVCSLDEDALGDYTCNHCQGTTEFHLIQDYMRHLQDQHLDLTWGCTLCSKIFLEREEEREHAKSFHAHLVAALPDAAGFVDILPSYACPVCGFSDSPSLWALDYHLRAVHQAAIQPKPASVAIDGALRLRFHRLQYDPRHSLLVCSGTREGVPRRDVEAHLAKCPHHVSTDIIRSLLRGMTLADAEDPLPLEMGAPIPDIPVEPGHQCGECKLAFTAPRSQPRKKIKSHAKESHGAPDVKSHPCSIQQWFGGNSSYRITQDPARKQWRYVVVDPNATDEKLASPSLVNQLELFERIIPPSPAPESVDVIDRRELGAVIHRLNLVAFASVEVMRSHHALCYTRHGTALQDVDIFSLCKDWIKLVQRGTDALPDQVRCWLATLRESEPSHAPFRAAVNKSTEDKRAHGIQSLLVFACALEHISSNQDIPDAWNWGDSRQEYWKKYVARFPSDPIWKTIREFKAGLRQPDGRMKRLGGLIWALARQGMNTRMGAWDRMLERFTIARIIDPRSIARSTPLFHRVTTMASEASQLSWIMRAAAVLQIQEAKDVSVLDAFDYKQHYDENLAPYLLATRETAFGTLRSMATWLSGVVSNQHQMDADGHFAWVGPSGHSDYTHFTWKQQVVPVGWVRRIPAAAVGHAQTQMRKLLDWVQPGWEPHDLSERISVGFGSNCKSDPYQLFVEGPNDSESFLTLPSAGLAPFADALKRELAAQSRLVVVVEDLAQVQQATQAEFFGHAADVALLVAIYTSVGPVPRGSELVLSSIQDSGRYGVRNLRVIGGQMMLVATYLKTRDNSDSGSIPRAIPALLAKLITQYLVLIRPLELHYACISGDPATIIYYNRLLFVSHGARLSTRDLSSELDKVAQTTNPQQGQAFPFRWGVQIWRQILKAVLREVVVPQTLRSIPKRVVEQDSYVYHAGFGHNERTSNSHYGVDQGSIVGISGQHLQAILEHCRRWHVWTGLEAKSEDAPPEAPVMDNTAGNVAQQLHLINQRVEHLHQMAFKTQGAVDGLQQAIRSSYIPGVTSPTTHGPGELLSVFPYLERVTGSAFPKSTEQAVLLQAVIRTQEHVLSVLPTGSGKSVAFMVPPLLPGTDITVAIIPFRALLADALDKMAACKISCGDGPYPPEGTRAVALSLEVAFQERTIRWMANDDRVRRIVVDEAHLALIWGDFRRQYFLQASQLGKMKKQVVLLTATAPFEQRELLLGAWGLSKATIIAAPHTQRPEVRFTFKAVERVDEDRVVEEMRRFSFAPDEGGIVFVLRRDDTMRVASAYQAKVPKDHPYAFMGGEGAHVGNYAEWRGAPRSPWMISTSALYHGIDHPRVRIAIFAGLPNTVSEFQQASGRLARALASGEALVLVPKKLANGAGGTDQHVLWGMAHGTEESRNACRRWTLSGVLDQHPISCAYMGGNVQFCDNCERAKDTPYKAYSVIVPSNLFTVAAQPIAPPPRKRQRFDERVSSPQPDMGASSSPCLTLAAYVRQHASTSPPTLPAPTTSLSVNDASQDHPTTLVWEPSSTWDVTTVLSWKPEASHQVISREFPNTQDCVACVLRGHSPVRHRDQAQRRAACPLYAPDYRAWDAFQSGWRRMQNKGAVAFREDMADPEAYAYCGSCFIETCRGVTHQCVFANHDQEGCRRRPDQDNLWLVRLAFLVLRQSQVRMHIAKALTEEDASSWSARQWGGWVSCPYSPHLSRASVVISLYLEHFRD